MRRKTDGRLLPDYDSMLDTMTNVVGVLVIVAAVVQVGVPHSAGAQKRDEASPPLLEVTPEALEQARSERESARAALAAAGRRRDEIEESLPAQQRDVERLRAELLKLEAAELEPAALQAERERLEVELRWLEEELKRLGEERRVAERALEEAKERARGEPQQQPAGRVVTLPDPDAALAQGKTKTFYYCRRGMIVPLAMAELASKSFLEAKKVVPGQSLDVSDARRIQKHFEGTDVGDESFRVLLDLATRMSLMGGRVGEQFSSCSFKYNLREGAPGEGEKAVAAPGSRYRLGLGQLDPRRHWIKFLVFDDSFEVYLAAKQLAEEAGIASGWTAFHGGEDIEVPLIRGSGGIGGRLDAPDS